MNLTLAVDCGRLPAPTNGTSAGGSTVFPNRVLFKCDSGFILSGSSKRTCQANATWSGFQPVCNGKLQATVLKDVFIGVRYPS